MHSTDVDSSLNSPKPTMLIHVVFRGEKGQILCNGEIYDLYPSIIGS